jgi:hypothetical protein
MAAVKKAIKNGRGSGIIAEQFSPVIQGTIGRYYAALFRCIAIQTDLPPPRRGRSARIENDASGL